MPILLRVIVALSLLSVSNSAQAQRIAPPGGGGGNPNAGDTYQFYVGGDLLRGLDPAWDPIIMAADNGDRLEIRGEGAFTTWPKDADGGGTFVHKDLAGNEIRRGRWIAVEFLSFNSYEGAGLGGQLGLRIELFPEGRTAGIPGKMQIDCPLGNAPPSSVFEARVLFQDSGASTSTGASRAGRCSSRRMSIPPCARDSRGRARIHSAGSGNRSTRPASPKLPRPVSPASATSIPTAASKGGTRAASMRSGRSVVCAAAPGGSPHVTEVSGRQARIVIARRAMVREEDRSCEFAL